MRWPQRARRLRSSRGREARCGNEGAWRVQPTGVGLVQTRRTVRRVAIGARGKQRAVGQADEVDAAAQRAVHRALAVSA